MAKGYHQCLNAAYRSDEWQGWANKELARFDQEGSLTIATKEVKDFDQDTAIQEAAFRLKKLLRLREELVQTED